MEIQLSVKNPTRALALLEFLQTSNLIDQFRIIDSPTIVNVAENYSFFDKFYGSTKSGKTMEQIDQYINSMRNEYSNTFPTPSL